MILALTTAGSAVAQGTAAASATSQFRGDASRSGRFVGPGPVDGAMIGWRFRTGGTVRSTPAVTEDVVYVGAGDGGLYAVDRATGEERWRAAAGGPVVGSPAVAGDLVVVTTRDGTVLAVHRSDGRTAWTVPGQGVAALPGGWDYYAASPAVVADRVVVGSPAGNVRALELESGRRLWTYEAGAPIRSTPAVAEGSIVVGDDAGVIHAVRLADGSPQWRHRTDGAAYAMEEWGFDRTTLQASPAIVDGTVYIGSRDGGLYALELATGARVWRVDYGFPWVVSSAAVGAGRVYVGSSDGHFVQAVDAESGEEVWRADVGSRVFASPALAGGTLYVADHRGFVRALDAGTGEERWSLRLAEQIQSSPVPAGRSLYIGADDGALYRLDATEAPVRHAVFFDSAMATTAVRPGGALLRDYLVQHGYHVLDASGIGPWLRDRLEDPAPSVVVFAVDQLPPSLDPRLSREQAPLLRRYLDAGGKVVWTGFPPWSLVRDSTGAPVRVDHSLHQEALGVDLSTGGTGEYGSTPTDAGRAWGLEGVRLSAAAVAPGPAVTALARDELGRISAAVRSYGGPSGTGLVVLYGLGATWDLLSDIRQAAEYGVVRER